MKVEPRVLIDARSLTTPAPLEANVCVVGAGPAGIALAVGLSGSGLRILVLESAGDYCDAAVQDLNSGPVIGDDYRGLRETRHRQLGGTVHAWNTPVQDSVGAKYLPLDPWDFERRAAAGLAGWPIEYSALVPFYERAQRFCGLGDFRYEAADWQSDSRRPLQLATDVLATRVYQFGSSEVFLESHLGRLEKSPDVTVLHGATVTEFVAGGGDAIEKAVAQVTTTGARMDVRADVFVLAGGAIENARQLLVLAGSGGPIAPDAREWVGRCFMEHPRDSSLTLVPHAADFFTCATFYDAHVGHGGTTVCGRIALAPGACAALELPNMSVTMLPRARAPSRLSRIAQRFGIGRPPMGYRWSEVGDPSRFFDAFRLLVNLEQSPDPDNRLVLITDRDALGLPRVALHWRWSKRDQARLVRLRRVLVAELERAGVGRVVERPDLRPDPNAHHHAGTTRMSAAPRDGVVDPDGRVHGCENLYVTGASVFPTAGFANPMLTIVAMALRLAEHLDQCLATRDAHRSEAAGSSLR